MLSRKVWSFTILLEKNGSQNQNVGVKQSKIGVNENSDFSY